MQRIHLDLKHRSGIPDAHALGADEIAKLSGFNLGNFVFRHALRSIVSELETYRPVHYVELEELLETEGVGDALVSCANWLGTRPEDESSNRVRAHLIERISGRVVSIGLGVQAPQGSEIVELGPESRRLARTLAAKGGLLSVRDRITARTLRAIGIDNVCVTGCPSNFINTDPSLGAAIAETAGRFSEASTGWPDTRVAVSEFTGGHARAGAVLRKMLDIVRDGAGFYVAQSPALLPFLYRETDDLPAVYLGNSGSGAAELRRLLRARALAFVSVESWLDFARTCSLSFGMRIHGTMIPLQAGVPSLLIGHDARTSGLAGEMGVPMMTPEQFLDLDTADPGALHRWIASEIAPYDDKRRELARRFETFLDSNDINASTGLRRLAAGRG